MNFEELLKKLILKIKEEESNKDSYVKVLLSFSSVLEKLHPIEFNRKKEEIGLDKVENHIISISKDVLSDIDNFEIDYYKNNIEINLEGSKLQSDLFDLSEYIENTMNLNKNSDDYLIALSFLSRRENFDMFQITQLILK